jgi:nucleotide-binding universal stress UspA family protein
MTAFVVPLDGSSVADRAIRPAVAFAARSPGHSVRLLHCTGADGLSREQLEARADRFRGVVDVAVDVVEPGNPAEVILDRAGAAGVQLCLATHGHGNVRSAILGGVATRVLCETPAAVLFVGPESCTTVLPGERARMVVCTDGSGLAESIVPYAASFATTFDLTACAAEVIPPNETVTEIDEPPRRPAPATDATDRVVQGLGRGGRPNCVGRALHGPDAARSIVAFADVLPAGVIAMATHGRSAVVRAVVGSVAAAVLRTAPCPVLVARPAGAAS